MKKLLIFSASARVVGSALLGGVLLVPASTGANETARKCAPLKWESTERVNLSGLPGQLIYVDFWASWCGPCKQSFPFMNALKQQFEAKGVSILAISVDKDIDEAKTFLRHNPAQFQVAHDLGGGCAKQFEVKGMPYSYIVAKSGEILYTHKGFRPTDTEEITKKLQALIKVTKD